MDPMKILAILLAALPVISGAAVITGNEVPYGDFPEVQYTTAEGLSSRLIVPLSIFRSNYSKNPYFSEGTAGWTFPSSVGELTYDVPYLGSGKEYLRLNNVNGRVVEVNQTYLASDGVHGKSYIQGAALVKGPLGTEGVVSITVTSSLISGNGTEKKQRFQYVGADQWNVVRFHFEQDLTGHKNVKVLFKYYPKQKGIQGLDGVYLDVVPASDVDLPPGVNATETDRAKCFLPGELEAFDARMDAQKVAVSGCSNGVIAPQSIIESYEVYDRNQNINCRSYRLNEFHTRFLDRYVSELTPLVDATERNYAAPNVLCASNMFYLWASRDAMTTISPYGSPHQSKLDRMWTFAGASAAYLKHPHVRQRAAGQSVSNGRTKDSVILDWTKKIAPQISAEIDVNRSQGHESNTQYWRAFSILPTALMNQDVDLLGQSRAVFVTALKAVENGIVPEEKKGFLPFELERGTRTIMYHGFAASPIYGMALYSQAYGCDFMAASSWRVSQVSRLTRKTIQGYYNQTVFKDRIRELYGTEVQPSQSDYRSLMYLGDSLDPAISQNVAEFLATQENVNLGPKYGRDSANPRLGGAYKVLAESALPELRGLDPGGLQPNCPY
jgi:hypothetical protein